MIPKECKRLAEVDFPIAVVSKHSAQEKSIRHGHPSTLHLWWARRPLAACRAMLMALLLPDPCDARCPEEFRTKARELLLKMPGWNSPRMNQQVKSDVGLRKAILTFIGDFANWDNAANTEYLAVARALVKAAYPEETPLVVDPFAGGGSIPLEALRIGCEAFASDLNPVACLILKVMLEDIPRHGPELAEELRRVGKEIKEKAEKELAEFYPPDPDGATPIAYLWARTVKCESPNCGAEIPLMRSFWLCKKANRKRALRPVVHHRDTESTEKDKDKAPCSLCLRGEFPHVVFEIFEPKSDKEVPSGTVTRAKATCPCCGTVLPPERVRTQLAEQRGGADVIFDEKGNRIGGARMTAVVTLHPGIQGRHYRLPTDRDYLAVWKAQKRIKEILDEWEGGGRKGLCPVPDEPTPSQDTHRAVGSQLPFYGHKKWGDLFTSRQQLLFVLLCSFVKGKGILPLMLSKIVRHCNAFSFWHTGSETVAGAFGRQAIPMCWDFPEYYPFARFAGGFDNALGDLVDATVHISAIVENRGQVETADAANHPLPDGSAKVWFTDPPYYDAIPYSNLADFFFVWLKRSMPKHSLLRDPYDNKNPLTPKDAEAVLCKKVKTKEGVHKDQLFYERVMAAAFSEGRRILQEDGVGSVVFAHKSTEGWEALISGIIGGGLTVTGSWPIATERGARLLARDTAALATSVHLVCRPRPEDAAVGDWADVLRELPNRVGDWMERLQGEGIRGADLVFACIGPALEIFSRYSKVETADGSEVTLAEYLEKVWELVGRLALEQVLGTADLPAASRDAAQAGAKARNGAAGAIEEDARLTALFLWTLQSTNGEKSNGDLSAVPGTAQAGTEAENEEDEDAAPRGKPKGYSLVFDVVRRFAQPLGIDLPKWEGRIIETKKGVVRLMAVSERAKQIFGTAGIESAVEELFSTPSSGQMILPGFEEVAAKQKRKRRGRGQKINIEDPGEMDASATTLDRVHAAMLLQSGGQANALRALIKAEQNRGPDFLRLANALSALYPKGSEEKRLLDAMLLAVPR